LLTGAATEWLYHSERLRGNFPAEYCVEAMSGSCRIGNIMAEFEVNGPINIPVIKQKSGGIIIDEDLLDDLSSNHPTLNLTGCYVFSRKSSKGSTPIYVGKTEKQNIRKEAFNNSNLKSVCRWVNDQSHKKLELWTVTQVKSRGARHSKAIDEIETTLIHWAKQANPKLLNKHKTKDANWSIKGVERSGRGRRPEAVKAFRKLMGLG